MTSNQDILALLRSDREERAREKEEEKEARAKERAEDIKKIEEMIIYGVKEEVKAVLKPIHDRLECQEKAVEDITRKFSFIMKEVAALRTKEVTILSILVRVIFIKQLLKKYQEGTYIVGGIGKWFAEKI